MKYFLVLVLLSAALFVQITPKSVSGSESLTKFEKDPWKYLTKFAISPVRGEVRSKFQFSKALTKGSVPEKIEMNLYVYLDEEWDMVRNLDTCEAKAKFARLVKPISIPSDGSMSDEFIGYLNQNMRTHVWFFVLADCSKNALPHTQGQKIKYDLKIFNSDGSHFSQEENGIIPYLFIVLAVLVGFFGFNSVKFLKFYKTEQSIDYPTLIITVALFFEFISVACELVHLTFYSVDGQGSFIFNFANQALSVTSQFIITCLLLLMAHGWSINFLKFEDMDVFIPLGVLLGLIHIIIVGVGRVADDEFYRYHDYDNWAGVFVMCMRILLFVFWIFLFTRTYKKTGKQSEKIFFNQFGLLSTLYFLAVPIVVMIATAAIAPYYRHKFVTIGTLLLQTGALIIFTLLFTTKSNKYYQISMKGKTLLPSNKYA